MSNNNFLLNFLFGTEKKKNISIPLISIFISLIAGALIIAILGKNPLKAYYSLLQGAGIFPKSNYASYKNALTDFMSTLDALTPMIFASLGVAVAFKAGLLNIGVSGQMLIAGFFSSILVGYNQNIDPVLAKILVIFIGMFFGGLVASFIAFLKYKFNINEVVSSIMTNYIIMYIISFFINAKYINPTSRQSKNILQTSRLTLINTQIGNLKMDIPLGIILSIICVIIIKFVLDKTIFGYEIKAIGRNKNASYYAGIDVNKKLIIVMFISGALAGLAGATYYLGYFSSIRPRVLSNVGFDAIAVSLLGNSNPVAIIFSSFLVTVMKSGSTYMSSQALIQSEIASLVTGIILLFSACTMYFKDILKKFENKNKQIQKINEEGQA